VKDVCGDDAFRLIRWGSQVYELQGRPEAANRVAGGSAISRGLHVTPKRQADFNIGVQSTDALRAIDAPLLQLSCGGEMTDDGPRSDALSLTDSQFPAHASAA
jgi:hypothetical protein